MTHPVIATAEVAIDAPSMIHATAPMIVASPTPPPPLPPALDVPVTASKGANLRFAPSRIPKIKRIR
jgi:hypothetical protein